MFFGSPKEKRIGVIARLLVGVYYNVNVTDGYLTKRLCSCSIQTQFRSNECILDRKRDKEIKQMKKKERY